MRSWEAQLGFQVAVTANPSRPLGHIEEPPPPPRHSLDNWCHTGNCGAPRPLGQDTPNPVQFLSLTEGRSGPRGQDQALGSLGQQPLVAKRHPSGDRQGRGTHKVRSNSTQHPHSPRMGPAWARNRQRAQTRPSKCKPRRTAGGKAPTAHVDAHVTQCVAAARGPAGTVWREGAGRPPARRDAGAWARGPHINCSHIQRDAPPSRGERGWPRACAAGPLLWGSWAPKTRIQQVSVTSRRKVTPVVRTNKRGARSTYRLPGHARTRPGTEAALFRPPCPTCGSKRATDANAGHTPASTRDSRPRHWPRLGGGRPRNKRFSTTPPGDTGTPLSLPPLPRSAQLFPGGGLGAFL